MNALPSSPPPGRPPVARGQALLIAVALAAVGVVAAAFALSDAPRRRAADGGAAAIATPRPPAPGFFRLSATEWEGLRFARVRRRAFADAETVAGSVVAPDDTTTAVLSPYTGRVTAVYATVGDTVRKGEPLLRVDGAEYAQAGNDLAAAETSEKAAGAQLRVAELNRRRQLALRAVGAVADRDVEQSAADLATARAAALNDRSATALVRSRLRILGLSEAAIAGLERGGGARTLAAGVTVPAPASGTVTQRAVGVGQNVASAASGSTTALLTIVDLSSVYLAADVPEALVGGVRPGDPVEATLLAFPGRAFSGTVRYVAPTVDPTTRRVLVRARIDNAEGRLRPGMLADVRVATGDPRERLAVPETAVVYDGDRAHVWVVGPDRTLALRRIAAGATVEGMVEAGAGLAPGDRVVTSGAVFIDRALRGDD